MSSALEDIKTIDLEEWLTLATAASPTKLKQGQSPDMENVWVDEKPGSVITAPGFTMVGAIPSGLPVTFCINFFRTSNGSQTFVVSDNATVWTTVDFKNFTSIITGLSASFQLRGKVIRDKLWLTNGSDAVRTFDGTTVIILDGTVGTPNVPRGRFIDYHDERVWLYNTSSARSAVYFSSLVDASATIIAPDNANAWNTTDNFLQISEGDADFGTGMIVYRGYLYLSKQYSIWRLIGYDEYTYSRVKTRSSTGTRFNESIQILDDVIHLIGIDGIYVFDGDIAIRISDIIDPATASQTAFGFNQLQQPNTNNQFWEVINTSDWNAGTVPLNIAVNNAITLTNFDDSQADFQSGATQTNVNLVTVPGSIIASSTNAGISDANLALGQTASVVGQVNASLIGSVASLTDGNLTVNFGCQVGNGGGTVTVRIPLPFTCLVSRIILKGVNANTDMLFTFYDHTGTQIEPPTAATLGSASGSSWSVPAASLGSSPQDITFFFTPFTATAIQLDIHGVSNGGFVVMTEVQVLQTAYNLTAKFVSRTLDLGDTPSSFGTFFASETLNGQGTSYFTQSSADGAVWNAETAVVNGGSIASALARYLRWGVNITTDGHQTPEIDSIILPAVYLSAVHNTGGSIFSWGPVESLPDNQGKTINFYYRTGTTQALALAASWNAISPGGVISDPIANQYVQFKIEISGGSTGRYPSVPSVTINWVIGTAGQAQTLQNVASVYWRNRYWLSAAGPGATENDTILIRGKKTFNSPWMLKDWNILSFSRYFDSLYGGSSLDGSIFKLDTGYSKNGSAMDSFFETGDFTFGGFTANFVELLVEAERTGSWNLTIGVSVDGGRTFTDYNMDLTVSTFDTEYIKRININFTTTRIRFRFRTNGIDTPFQVHRCLAMYELEVERGSIRGDYRTA